MGACLLPFPQKFDAARSFVDSLPHGSELLSDDAWLALGALSSQATRGPCQEPKKWSLLSSSSSSGGDPAAEAAWRELGTMPSAEAMRLFVRVLDEEAPGWWRAVGAVGSSGIAVVREEEEGEGGKGGKKQQEEEEEDDEDIGRWVSLSTTPDTSSASTSSTSSSTPCPRYEHAAALLGRALFVVGGSRAGGRMLSDSWALDLETLRWSNLFQSSSASSGSNNGSLPPRAGLCLLPWKKPGSSKPASLLAIGGHAPKSGRGGPAPTEMEVWRLESTKSNGGSGSGSSLPSWRWALVPTSVAEGARPPPPRGGHSVTVIPGTSRAFVFGGEVDGDGKGPTSDLFELRLDSMTWRGPLRVRGGDSSSSSKNNKNAASAANAPSPRSGHVAAAVGRFLVVFGGADGDGEVFSDVAVLDVDSLEWLRPAVEIREEEEEEEDEGDESDDGDKKRRRRNRNRNRRKLIVSPRAGASAAVIGRTIFVAGGGDGSDSPSASSSSTTTLALDCSWLPRGPLIWRRAAADDDEEETSPSASPASSEGLALVALPQVRALLAFGGNAGRLHANLAVLRPRAGVIIDDDDEGEGEQREEEAAANGGGSAGASSDDEDEEIPSAAAPRPSAAAAAAAATATASSSPSPSELALMRRQLASAQAAAADAVSRAEEAELERERLALENARLRRRLAAVLNGDDSEEDEEEKGDKEGAEKRGNGENSSRRPRVWAYISGA